MTLYGNVCKETMKPKEETSVGRFIVCGLKLLAVMQESLSGINTEGGTVVFVAVALQQLMKVQVMEPQPAMACHGYF